MQTYSMAAIRKGSSVCVGSRPCLGTQRGAEGGQGVKVNKKQKIWGFGWTMKNRRVVALNGWVQQGREQLSCGIKLRQEMF